MPFGLKKVEATYQRAMNTIFHNLIGRYLKCYIDDIVVKSQSKEENLFHLESAYERKRKCMLKLYPLKCAFGVLSGNFLG